MAVLRGPNELCKGNPRARIPTDNSPAVDQVRPLRRIPFAVYSASDPVESVAKKSRISKFG